MKIYKIDSLTTILFTFLIFSLVALLPISLIEAFWNGTIGKSFTDISINFWQALILWLMVLVVLNIIGIFKFEFAVESRESFDKELIKQKIQDIKDLSNKIEQTKIEVENKAKKDEENKIS